MNRKEIDLLLKGMISRYDRLRVEIAFINKLSADVIDETNKIFSDDDDNEDSEESSDYATSSQKRIKS